MEPTLTEHLAVARMAWPNLPVTDHEFTQYVKERCSGDELPPVAQAADLLLACSCVAGHQEAHALFHTAYEPVVVRVLRRRAAQSALLDDVKQTVFEKLLVASPGERPKLADYRGYGSLKSWVSAMVATTLLMARRTSDRRREQSSSVDDSLVGSVIESGPELRILEQHYRAPVASAIVFALGQLSDRDRVLLRLHLSERLSIDRLGTMYGVNRATAARWLARARAALLQSTREELRRGLGISDDECDSILKLVRSQLDVSIVRHLSAPA